MRWIGRMVDIITVVTVKKDGPAKSVEDARKTEVIAGITRPGATTHLPFAIMNWALGTKFKIVSGYKGSAGPALAFDRGEVQAAAAPWGTLRTRRPHFLKELQIVQIALAKDKDRPDVPLLMDLVTDPDKKAAVRFLSAQASIGRTLSAPPGVPADRIAALRRAFDATMADPKFLAAARKRKMELAPASGEEVEKMVLEHLSTPPAIIGMAKTASGIK
jgi:tripartite-type tricarboxylate transporter receptor subunit TctC